MLVKSLKCVIQFISLLTVSALFLGLWLHPESGFTTAAALALASVAATQWTVQKAWRIHEKSKSVFKVANIAVLMTLSLSFSTTGLLAGVDYGGVEELAGVVAGELTNEREMSARAMVFKEHVRQTAQGFHS